MLELGKLAFGCLTTPRKHNGYFQLQIEFIGEHSPLKGCMAESIYIKVECKPPWSRGSEKNCDPNPEVYMRKQMKRNHVSTIPGTIEFTNITTPLSPPLPPMNSPPPTALLPPTPIPPGLRDEDIEGNY